MSTKYSLEIIRNTSLDLKGNEERSFIEPILIKNTNNETEKVYIDTYSDLEAFQKAKFYEPANLLNELMDNGKMQYVYELIAAKEYDYAGKTIKITLKDVLLFCEKHYQLNDEDKGWLTEFLDPYIQDINNKAELTSVLFQLIKVTLNDNEGDKAEDINKIFNDVKVFG